MWTLRKRWTIMFGWHCLMSTVETKKAYTRTVKTCDWIEDFKHSPITLTGHCKQHCLSKP